MEIEQWLGHNNKLGIDIWRKKYCHNGESLEQWLDRVSGNNSDIRQMIANKEFLFGGRILANRGLWKTGLKVTLSNCYVVEPPKDSIESIFETAGKLARIFSYGGGCGIDISKLAPKGAKINNTALETSGAVSFTDLFAMVTGLIGQHGRRGALMLSISCEHPDLEDFMAVKTDVNRATKANMSIRMTDKFMNAIKGKETFVQTFIRPETGSVTTKSLNAREFFRKMCYANWDFGEPGCLYWDRIESWNLLSEFPNYHYAGTNPCAEEPLPAGGSCLLGSINLAAFVKNNRFEEEKFRKAVDICVKGLNEVLDDGIPLHPLKEQTELATNWRQIGLGVMGFADMLIKLQLTYGSDEALEFCDKIGFIMADEAIKKSALLAKDHGAFPMCNIDQILASPYFQLNTTDETKELVKKYGLRNSQLLTIAPTGSLSTMLGVSGGIEPIFANFYSRKTVSLSGKDEYYKVYTPIVKNYMDKFELTSDKDLPKFFITAQELDYKRRILQQSKWQKHIDASISSTINLPNNFPEKDIYDLYMFAWETGCKGVTIFRDGCKRVGILDKGQEKRSEEKTVKQKRGFVENVADDVVGKKRKLITGCGSLHCTAFFNPHTGDLVEAYLNKGSTGGCNNFMIGLSRMISLAARSGCNIEDIVDQLESCGSCSSYAVRTFTKNDTSRGSCCPMAVGYALTDMYKEMQREIRQVSFTPVQKKDENGFSNFCPECKGKLESQGGCNICKNCGWTRCD